MRSTPLLFAAAMLPGVVLAQTGTIRGTVVDAETGLPLAGANVVVVELTIGAATTIDGEYAIDNIPVGTYTVQTSFVGFRTVEHRITVVQADMNHNVRLEVDLAKHDEILVTGMASRRSRATSDVAVGRIDAKEPLKNNAYQDVTQLINGRVSGVTVQPASGNVATGMRFIIRSSVGLGDGQPIVFVDGARVNHFEEVGGFNEIGSQGVSQLAHLNPDDIEKIEILKGPAGAALYGTSAANGVVLITTKKGSLGSGIRQGSVPFGVTYEGTLGANRQAESYSIFNSSTPDATNAIFRDGALSEHMLKVNGGSQSVRFYASYSNRNEDGHILGTAQDRHSLRANFEAFPTNRFTVRANTGFVRNSVQRPPNDWSADGWLRNTSVLPTPYLRADSVAIANVVDIQDVSRFTASADLEYRPISGLTIKALVGYDGTDLRNDYTRPAGFRYGTDSQGEGSRGILDKESRLATFDLNAQYRYSIAPGLTGATTVGTQATDSRTQGNLLQTQGFVSGEILSIGAGAQVVAQGENSFHVREQGIFGLQDFAYDDKLFLTLGLRRDYASAIGLEAPSIVYPRASAAVRLDRLVSLPSLLPFLKFRMAYGEAGRLPGPLDGLALIWGTTNSGYGPGASTAGRGNPEIKPERTKELETGVEVGFLANRLNLELTYYRQTAADNIVSLPNPPSSGYAFYPSPFNLASAKGWGVESMLTATPIRSANTRLDLSLVWNWIENEITDLGGSPPLFSFIPSNAFKEGLPREAYYVWRSVPTFGDDGSYTGPALASTGDADEDGIPDREFLGIPYPDQSGSFQVTLRFLGDFYLTGLADWQLGLMNLDAHKWQRVSDSTDVMRNVARVRIGAEQDPCAVHLCDDNGAMRPELVGMDVTPQPVGSESYRQAAGHVASTELLVGNIPTNGNFVEDASFFTLRELSIRYDFTQLLLRNTRGRFVRSLSLTLAGRNLFTASPYGAPDPVSSSFGAQALLRASGPTLPSPRVIYFKLSVGV